MTREERLRRAAKALEVMIEAGNDIGNALLGTELEDAELTAINWDGVTNLERILKEALKNA